MVNVFFRLGIGAARALIRSLGAKHAGTSVAKKLMKSYMKRTGHSKSTLIRMARQASAKPTVRSKPNPLRSRKLKGEVTRRRKELG